MIKNQLLSTAFTGIICALLFCTSNLKAQISEGGLPPSFNYPNTLKSELVPVQIPINFSVEDMKTVDAWKVSQGSPLKVATLISTDLTPDNSGIWNTLPNGEKVWQLRIQAKDAIAIMLYYNAFHIPEGGKLFIYNVDRTQVLGAYTYNTNPSTDKYATEFVAGDDIILEYVAAPSGEKPRIGIEEIGYGYNHLYIDNSFKAGSGYCMVNINCEEGDAWQNEKKGVCQMSQKIGKSTYICSGSLINNTAEDLKPYILSAYHCSEAEGVEASASDYAQWTFNFHYEQRKCSVALPAIKKTITGCTHVASSPIHGGSDGLLLLLNQNIPEEYNVYYNGWDRSNTPSLSGVGIHHPNGDYKKISTFTKPASTATWADKDGNIGKKEAHWLVRFEETTNGHAVTEGGSSGSPLFNQNKLIVGSLSGGNSSCENPAGNSQYGKLYYHWDKQGTTGSERMDIYLDPLKTGATTLSGRYHEGRKASPSELNIKYHNQKVELSWKAAETTPSKYLIYINNQTLGETENLTFTADAPSFGTQMYSVSALYDDGKESNTISEFINIIDYKAPTDLTGSYISGTEITLNWKAPIYEQNISWSDLEYYSNVGMKEGTPFYFGQYWSPEELSPIHKKKLTAVEFYPAENATYSIYILYGENVYTQKIEKNQLSINTLSRIKLDKPIVIDSTQDLIVSIYAESYNTENYPAFIDAGPAKNGKGNILSEDGMQWGTLASSNMDYNFCVSAVITSEEGELSTAQSAGYRNIELSSKKISQPIVAQNLKISSSEPTVSLQSGAPSAFIEITGYNVYRDGVKINTTPVLSTNYKDKGLNNGTYTYQVTALYGEEESAKSNSTGEVAVGTESINKESIGLSPIPFNEYIRLSGFKQVSQVEILTSDGKRIKRIDRPENIIYTDHLASGIYIFRLHTENGIKTIRAIKQ